MTKAQGLVALVVVAVPMTAHAGIYDEVNLALGKATSQSSTYPGGDSYRAVDGNTDGNFSDGSVALTNDETNAWWQVDLGQVRQIGRIEISPRTDWCPTCMYPYMIIVSDYEIVDTDITDPDASSWVYLMRVKVGSNLNKIPINRSGRYVRIALQSQNYLQLAEVKVIEQFNSAQARSATQSSTPYVGYDASRAVDGVTTGNTSTGDVAITNNETKPWWQVDMGFVQPVREVHIWSSNVTCCATSNPKKGLYVFASTSPITADPLTTPQPGVNTFHVAAQGWPAVVPINVNAEYIRVQLDGTDSLSLSEVQVFTLSRGSLGGHPSLSSVGTGSWPATSMIDNNLVTGDVSTQTQSDNYFDVDLGTSRYINTIRVWSSTTASIVNADYYLFVSQTPFTSNGAPATTLAQTMSSPGAVSWIRSGNADSASTTEIMMRARYIRVIQSQSRPLTGLRELEVITPQVFQNGDINGWVNTSNPLSLTFPGSGYTSRPGATVYIYGYQPNVGAGGGTYQYITRTTSSMSPTMTTLGAAPLYWFATPAFGMPSSLWPQGGMSGLYYITYEDDVNNYVPMRGYDIDYQENPYWPDVRSVSSTPTPDNDATPPVYLDSPMQTWLDPNYYPGFFTSTLTAFMNTFFPAGGTYPVAARFYNKNELGIGREVRCVHNPVNTSPYTGIVRSGTICIAKQYGALNSSTGGPLFGDQTSSLSQLQQINATPLDTAAIILPDGTTTPFFGFYDSSGNLTRVAYEDNSGQRHGVPNDCMSCHGGSGATESPAGSTHWFPQTGILLPIDPGQVVFTGSPYTYSQQQESIRSLNAMILAANPTPAVADFINGAYPGGVNVSGSQANLNYIPSAWNLTDGRRQVYTQAIKPYCRMCHMSQQKASGGFEFTNPDDVEALRALVVADVCKLKRMPHAQQTLKQLWASSGRAAILGFFGRHDFDGEACTP